MFTGPGEADIDSEKMVMAVNKEINSGSGGRWNNTEHSRQLSTPPQCKISKSAFRAPLANLSGHTWKNYR